MIYLLILFCLSGLPDPQLFNNYISDKPLYEILIKADTTRMNNLTIPDYKDAVMMNLSTSLDKKPCYDKLMLMAMVSNLSSNKLGVPVQPFYALVDNKGYKAIRHGFTLINRDKTREGKASYYMIYIGSVVQDTVFRVQSPDLEISTWIARTMLNLLSSEEEQVISTMPFPNAITEPHLAMKEGFIWAEYLLSWEGFDEAKRKKALSQLDFDFSSDPHKWILFNKYSQSFSHFSFGVYRKGLFLWLPFYMNPIAIKGIPENLFIHQGELPEFLRKGYSDIDALQYIWLMPPEAKFKKKNLSQALSCPGVCGHFFYKCMKDSVLQNTYANAIFYKPFIKKGIENLPDSIITRLFPPEFNVRLKLLFCLMQSQSRKNEAPLRSLTIDYMKAFPKEAERVKVIYQEATGYSIYLSPPPQIWLESRSVYGGWALLFGKLSPPTGYYRFDLNSATEADLRCIKGIKPDEIKKILDYREGNVIKDLDKMKEAGISDACLQEMHYMAMNAKESEGKPYTKIFRFKYVIRNALLNLLPFLIIPLILFLLSLSLLNKYIARYEPSLHGVKLHSLSKENALSWILKFILSAIASCLILLLLPMRSISTIFYLYVALVIWEIGFSFISYSLRKETYNFKYKVILSLIENALLVGWVMVGV